jgi:hypothetical protein
LLIPLSQFSNVCVGGKTSRTLARSTASSSKRHRCVGRVQFKKFVNLRVLPMVVKQQESSLEWSRAGSWVNALLRTVLCFVV